MTKGSVLLRAIGPRLVLAATLALVETVLPPPPAAGADPPQPGMIAQANGWTLKLRADRFVGARPAGEDHYKGAAITSDPWMYPVIVLDGPAGAHYEYSLLGDPRGTTQAMLGNAGDVFPPSGLRLEPDWDGDGLPEVYFEYSSP